MSAPWSWVPLGLSFASDSFHVAATVHISDTRIEDRFVVGWHVPSSGSSPLKSGRSLTESAYPDGCQGLLFTRIRNTHRHGPGLPRLRGRTEFSGCGRGAEDCVAAPWFKFPTPNHLRRRSSTMFLHACAAPPVPLVSRTPPTSPRPLAAQVVIRAGITPRTQNPALAHKPQHGFGSLANNSSKEASPEPGKCTIQYW